MIEIPKVIKDKLNSDNATFNVRIHFPNGERTDICNNKIVSGSVKFTESLCSQNELKFGLCESPVFECETVNVGNIKDCLIDVSYEVLCGSDTVGAEWRTDIQKHVFSIPVGLFVVEKCDRQADIQHRKIVAYGGGAATDWSFPEWEVIRMKRYGTNDTKFQYDLYKLSMTKFNWKSSVLERLNATRYKRTHDERTFRVGGYRINFYIDEIQIYIPNSLNRLVMVDYEWLQSASEARNNITKTLEKYAGEYSSWGMSMKRYMEEIYDYYSKGMYADVGGYLVSAYNYYFKEKNYIYLYDQNNMEEGRSRCVIYVPLGYRCRIDDGTQLLEEAIEYMIDESTVIDYFVNVDFPTYNVKKTRQELIETDLQKIVSNEAELEGKFAKIDRFGNFDTIDIKRKFYLKPSEDLKPDEQLKPLGASGGFVNKSMYSNCWYDENYSKPFGAVHCQFKNTSNVDTELYVYCQNYDADSEVQEYQIYDISNNEIVKENKYTVAQMTSIMQTIADAISGVSYVPVRLQAVALPNVESGDTLEILTQNNDSVTTIVLNRTMSGESYITDEFTSV